MKLIDLVAHRTVRVVKLADKSDQLARNYSRLEAAISRRQQLLERLEVINS